MKSEVSVVILVFGDIMGRIGREAVKLALPGLKDEFKPDLTIANGENMAHGKGMTPDTVKGLLDAGIDLITGGNHVWDRKESYEVFADPKLAAHVIRPANYPPGVPGHGEKLLTVGLKTVLVVNLLGRVFIREDCDDPFRTFDSILQANAKHAPSVVLVDMHAEASSEKQAFGWHVDGQATAVWGTHTHVPTSDGRVLPGGTAFITDVGMCGVRDGVIGLAKEAVLSHFLTQLPMQPELPTAGEAVVDAIVVKVEGGRAESIEHVRRLVTVK